MAAIGGVLKNHLGEFIFGFASHLGEASITEAELRAILMDSILIKIHGWVRVVIESDSSTAVKLINMGCSPLHPYFSLVRDIRDLLPSNEVVRVVHTLREANQVADCFAKFGLSLDRCSSFYNNVPGFASMALSSDLAGTFFPRGF